MVLPPGGRSSTTPLVLPESLGAAAAAVAAVVVYEVISVCDRMLLFCELQLPVDVRGNLREEWIGHWRV